MQSDMLDVVIGVVFVWLLLSMVLSGVNEGLSLLTHARAKHLWLGIGRLFDPARSPLPRTLLDIGFRLPFTSKLDLRPRAGSPSAPSAADGRPDPHLAPVRARNESLYKALEPQLLEMAKSGRLSKVTHVAAGAFSEAVLKVASRVHPEDLRESAVDLNWTEKRRRWLRSALQDAPAETALPLDDVVALAGADVAEEDLRALYRHASRRLSGRDVAELCVENRELAEAVKQAVLGIDAVDERVTAVRGVVESWFERTMAQMSTFYRRQSRKVLGLLAIPLVLFAQANSIAIFEDLRKDAGLRQDAVAAAGAITDADLAPEDCAAAIDRAADGSGSTTTSTSTTTTTAPGATTTTVDPVVAASRRLQCSRDILDRASRFRVGLAWQELKEAHGVQGDQAKLQRADVWPYLGHALFDDWGLFGRTITLVALLFGAQFWFDVLRRLVGVRKALAGNQGGGGTTAG